MTATERVGAQTLIAYQTLTVTPGLAYTSGDLVGGKIVIGPAVIGMMPSGLIQSIVITDRAQQSPDLDLVFFDADPTSTTFTDNEPFAIHDDDLPHVCAWAQVTQWAQFVDSSMGQAANLALPFVCERGQRLYAAIVVRSSPTFVANTDLSLRLHILQA